MNRFRSPLRPTLMLAIASLTAALSAQGTPVGFEETWALSTDRAEAIRTLTPGTEPWYYYQCRERLDAGDFDTVRTLLAGWAQRLGRSTRTVEIENRAALLGYAKNPAGTFDFLRTRLDLRFDHQRVLPGAKSELPTQLDPRTIAPETLSVQARRTNPNTLDGFTDHALLALAADNLSADELHSLVQRLQRPDVPNLPALVIRDLDHKQSGGFGSLAIHGELRIAQLEECLRLRPALLQEPQFVAAYLARLAPGAETDLGDPVQREAHLQRLWQFAQRLAPSFNSQKAQILYHWLALDLTKGAPDRDRFLQYLRLPRQVPYLARGQQVNRRGDEFADLNGEYVPGLPAIRSDVELVQACFAALFARENGYEPYVEFVDGTWLKRVFAETKLLLGQGDAERWTAMIDDAGAVRQLEQRVEILFPRTQTTQFAADAAVGIDVDVKNVPTLLVKVYAIDAFRYYVERQREIDASIELDGLIPNHEQTATYQESPLRRIRRHFDLPMLKEPGTYVVEFVGNGISSRAVVHKGGLRAVDRPSAGGHTFRVYDETGAHQKQATIWFGGREYTADTDGEITLPFTTDAGTHQVVLRSGRRAALDTFAHRPENYALSVGLHVEREALIAAQPARLLVHPNLTVAGRPLPLRLLERPVLQIVATDVEGKATTQEVRDLALTNDGEFVHELRVPERLTALAVTLRGTVKGLDGKDVELSGATAQFRVNRMDETPATATTALLRTVRGYVLEARGKDGETKEGQQAAVTLQHRDYRQPVQVALQTDANGRIDLGMLPGIERIDVQLEDGSTASYDLLDRDVALPATLQGAAGEVLRIPYLGTAKEPTRAEFSLLGQANDEFAHLAIADGFVELRDLAPGDYQLVLHETGERIVIRVTAGAVDGGWVLGRQRSLLASSDRPLNLLPPTIDGQNLRIRVANASASTRVHVFATRFAPAFDAFADLAIQTGDNLPVRYTAFARSSFHAGRELNDEYRYVLERRYAQKYPGNMLQRPSLLLNPWAIDDHSQNEAANQWAPPAASPAPESTAAAPGAPHFRSKGRRDQGGQAEPGGIFANFDYLPRGAATLANLRPDANGVITVPLADLGEGQVLRVVAIDGGESLSRTLVRDEQPLRPRARHLQRSLDPASDFSEQKRIEFVAAGGQISLGEAHSAEIELFDSLASVHRLWSTLSRNPDLAKFEFVLRWPHLTSEEKRKEYAANACHELDFFVHEKDPQFFAAIVKPFLANKATKKFLDHWLLDDDLRGYLEPWQFAQLNLIEKILLAKRIGGDERDATARLVGEGVELHPVDAQSLESLFFLALRNSEMDQDAGRSENRFGAEPMLRERLESARGMTVTGGGGGGRGVNDPARAAKPGADRGELKDEEAKLGDDSRFAESRERVAEDKKVDALRRVAQLYRAVDPTKVLAEHDYYHRTIQQTTPDVVAPGRFWLDYATAPAGQPFASTAILEVTGSFLEMMMALSVLDLPFDAGKHEYVGEGADRAIRAATPLLLARKEVTPASKATDLPPLLLGQNFYRLDDRYRFEGSERRDAFVTDEFLAGVAYGCQVVVTNPTSTPRKVNVLLQIPAGALPVQRGFWTRGTPVELGPYATTALEYQFYFPADGDFAHYPAHAAENGKLAAAVAPKTLHVVLSPTKVDATSWEHVSQMASATEVLAHIDGHNVQRLDLSRLAWRMRDREFFTALLNKLRARHVFEPTLWSYGILHRDPGATREYLAERPDFLAQCGTWLRSPLLDIDPIERRSYQHLELDPLVHPRAHQLENRNVIRNADLAAQYAAFVDLLGYHPKLDAPDWLAATYYLLLQNRIADALAAFAKVDGTKLTTRLQYDYLQAYLCFFTGDTRTARDVASRHRDEPIAHWQKRFRDVLAQLDEAEGKAPTTGTEPSQDVAAALAPSLELALDGKRVVLSYKNLAQCEVRYYALDVEFAFSSQPFGRGEGRSAAYVQPTLSEVRDLPKDGSQVAFALPDNLQTANVLVEVRAAGLLRSQQFFANKLDVRFLESYGQVAVAAADGGAPISRAYVKVFARMPDGSIKFHKDGYTDLRGRFDYASLSDDPNLGAERYAVLVLDEQRGATVRDIAPPSR